MWRVIGITPEKGVRDEQKRVVEYLNSGIDIFHIRKPRLTVEQLKYYLDEFPLDIRQRLTIHYHTSLALEFGLGGVHYNLQNPFIKPIHKKLRKSYSSHSIAEMLDAVKVFDYVFLSPIYDSISKQGYNSNFHIEDLKKLNLINDKVVALGGVREDRFEELREAGFGGAALLGSLWEEKEEKI